MPEGLIRLIFFSINPTNSSNNGRTSDLQLPPPVAEPARKYEHSQAGDEQKQEIARKLRTWFEKEKPYLDDQLTLGQVSEAMRQPRNLLSQVLNETEEKSFYDYVNDYRINAAKALLEDASQDHISVDGIAVEVGFRSRSVFYTAFKKRTNATPASWRRNRGE